MFSRHFIYLLLVHCLDQASAAKGSQIATKYGIVQGYTDSGAGAQNVDVFKGIPYAKPPLGKLFM